jgi:hypothetical protein
VRSAQIGIDKSTALGSHRFSETSGLEVPRGFGDSPAYVLGNSIDTLPLDPATRWNPGLLRLKHTRSPFHACACEDRERPIPLPLYGCMPARSEGSISCLSKPGLYNATQCRILQAAYILIDLGARH